MFSLVEYFFHLRMNGELGCGGNDVCSYWFFNFLAGHVVLISATHPIAVTDVCVCPCMEKGILFYCVYFPFVTVNFTFTSLMLRV